MAGVYLLYSDSIKPVDLSNARRFLLEFYKRNGDLYGKCATIKNCAKDHAHKVPGMLVYPVLSCTGD